MSQYPILLRGLQRCSEPERQARIRNLCRTDLDFLLRHCCRRVCVINAWKLCFGQLPLELAAPEQRKCLAGNRVTLDQALATHGRIRFLGYAEIRHIVAGEVER